MVHIAVYGMPSKPVYDMAGTIVFVETGNLMTCLHDAQMQGSRSVRIHQHSL